MSHSERFLKLVASWRPTIQEYSVYEVFDKVQAKEPFYLIDIREESEWQMARIPGALYLGKGVIERDIEHAIPDANAKIVLYCGGGFRSVIAAKNLKDLGYTNVCSMDGGIRGWREAGFPITTSS